MHRQKQKEGFDTDVVVTLLSPTTSQPSFRALSLDSKLVAMTGVEIPWLSIFIFSQERLASCLRDPPRKYNGWTKSLLTRCWVSTCMLVDHRGDGPHSLLRGSAEASKTHKDTDNFLVTAMNP
jgi:hypothetical protein